VSELLPHLDSNQEPSDLRFASTSVIASGSQVDRLFPYENTVFPFREDGNSVSYLKSFA